MNVQVKSGDQTVTVSADASWTVLQLKEALQAKLGVAASAQKLTVGGKIMKDAKTLADFPAAGSQTVNLVTAAGAVPAKAGGAEASGDRAKVDGMVNELISMIKSNKEAQALYEKHGKDVPDTTDLQAALGVDGVESVKKKVLDELTEVMDGNWSALNQYHEPLREYGFKLLGTREVLAQTRDEWVEKAATFGMEKFEKYPDVQKSIAEECKPDRDLIKELLPVAKKIARRMIDLFLDGPDPRFAPDHDDFAKQLRLLVVTAVGALMDGIVDCLRDGQPQCQQLMAKVTGMIIERLSKKFPEYNTLFAFGGPMAMNQLIEWHDEYVRSIKGKSFP